MNEVVTKTSDNDEQASLELSNKIFADVILNFLGKKEKLKYEEKLSFKIRLNDIEQFYYLLNEKISREHNVFIDHFMVSITYNDNTIREISGIDALTQPLCTKVHRLPPGLKVLNHSRIMFPVSILDG